MDVTTNLKYRRKKDSCYTTGYLKLYFPRKIVVTKEIGTKSFSTVGKDHEFDRCSGLQWYHGKSQMREPIVDRNLGNPHIDSFGNS